MGCFCLNLTTRMLSRQTKPDKTGEATARNSRSGDASPLLRSKAFHYAIAAIRFLARIAIRMKEPITKIRKRGNTALTVFCQIE